MAKRASVSVRIPAANAGAVYAQMLAGITRPISLREIKISLRSNVQTLFGVTRAWSIGTATVGTNVATGHAFRHPDQPHVDGRVEIGWSVTPTGQTGVHSYLRRQMVDVSVDHEPTPGNATVATGAIAWLLRHTDRPIVVEPTGATGMGLLLVNAGSSAGAEVDVLFSWDYGDASDV
jgi:hypothetical protein